jgi:hypothetical protein
MFRYLLACLSCTVLWADPSVSLKALQALPYVDAHDNTLTLSDDINRIVISFDQEGNGLMTAFLKTQPKDFISSQEALYLGDISAMPFLVTKLFAKPRMQSYDFPLYLHEENTLKQIVPSKPDHVTVLVFDKNGTTQELFFTQTAQEAFGLIR